MTNAKALDEEGRRQDVLALADFAQDCAAPVVGALADAIERNDGEGYAVIAGALGIRGGGAQQLLVLRTLELALREFAGAPASADLERVARLAAGRIVEEWRGMAARSRRAAGA